MFHSTFLTTVAAGSMALSMSMTYGATMEELMRMTDQLDQMDRLDFQAHLDKADQCARSRDLACAETQLGKAAKLANGTKDKSSLARAREGLLAVRKQIADEAAVLAQRQAELERQEARLQEQQEEAERQARRRARESDDDDDSSSTASTLALFGSLVARNYANQNAIRSVERATAQRRFNDMQSGVANNIARDQQRFAQERAQIQAQRDALQSQSHTARAPVLAAMPTPPAALRPVEAATPSSRTPDSVSSNSSLNTPRSSATMASKEQTAPTTKDERRLYTYTKDSFIFNSPASLFNDEQKSQEDVEKQFRKYSGRNLGGNELAWDANVNTEIISRGNTLCETYRYAGRDSFKCKIPVVIKYTSYKDPNGKETPGRGVSR